MKDIKIAGIQRNSFVDWPAKISSVIFLGGCNFTCPHCHNHTILCGSSNILPLKDALNDIREQIGFIDGVVISGGEPTLHPNLRDIIHEIRAMGLAVKLDTNGSNPKLLKDLLHEGIIDFVAMDIKAPFERYHSLGFIKNPLIIDDVKKSVKILKQWNDEFVGDRILFRTTPVPQLTKGDLDGVKLIVDGYPYKVNDFTEIQ